MMIIGIGGCTSLLIAGFGIRDTIQPIVDHQYGEINLYDATVSFLDEPTGEQMQVFREEVGDFATDVTFVHSGSVELVTKNSLSRSDFLVVLDGIERFTTSTFFITALIAAVVLLILYFVLKALMRNRRRMRMHSRGRRRR